MTIYCYEKLIIINITSLFNKYFIMNWLKPRKSLNIYCSNLNKLKKTKDWNKNRQIILEKYNFSCCYCGGIYRKNLNLIDLDDQEICCRACYLITHINWGFCSEMMLFNSKYDQLTIVRKTINYIIKENRIPQIFDIDNDAKEIPLSIYEFSNILIVNKKIPKEMKNYKIFFTSLFDYTFLFNNNLINKFMFDDDNDQEIEYQNNFPNYDFTLDEIKFLEDYFESNNNNNIDDKITDLINHHVYNNSLIKS